MQHTQNPNTAISTYYAFPYPHPQQVTPSQINTVLKNAISQMGLHRYGFSKTNVSSHSLRAGGAMAMKLNGIDTITIKKHGRWSSNTFLEYIHEQIGAFTAGVSKQMSQYIPFQNMAPNDCAPQTTEPLDPLTTTPN
jgi:hypothetical protein